MRKLQWLAFLALVGGLAMAPAARAQVRPYVGYVYPAGGQQGTTFQIRFGGQSQDDVNAVLVTGSGVTANVVDYHRRLDNQEMQLLNEQLKALKRATPAATSTAGKTAAGLGEDESAQQLIARIETRNHEFVPTPACAAISTLTMVEVAIAPDAEPGQREIRVATWRGISNPLVLHVGHAPEFSRKPMLTATLQVLGKEAQSLRKRPADEVENRITIPCTVNGQIASGEVNRYRFEARRGQRLVISTQGRQLIPFIADTVPGWFQPVLALYDAKGKEVAFDDDYRFKPDPVILYEAPRDGEYVFAIRDSLFRGREDFVYRITIGELPFVTSLFPLGRQAGTPVTPGVKGWNLQEAALTPPPTDAGPGIYSLAASRNGFVSDPVPFALDTLPETFEKEPNNTQAVAQKVTLPIIVNGRINKPDDWDVFQFNGKSNDTVVAEVQARRLDSPLDSVIKLTDANGNLLAFNDDHEDLGAGVNTHHADSWFMVRLPADGAYFVHIGDIARLGGEEYAYRLRLSAPQPDFALRVVPSSVSLRGKSTASLSIYAIRKDGFTGPIKLALRDPPAGFRAPPVTLSGTQVVARITVKTDLAATKEPLNLFIVGSAKIGEKEIAHEAAPAEDRMQAFLWRHLVPAIDLKVLVFDPNNQPSPKRVAPVRPPSAVATNLTVATNAAVATNTANAIDTTVGTNATVATKTNAVTNAGLAAAAANPKFTKQRVVGRLRQLKRLYEEGLLTDDFYNEKVAECEAAP
jgi:hypothetical protein